MEKDRNYYLERNEISRKVKHQLEQEVLMIKEQVESSKLLLGELENEVSFIENETTSVRRQIVRETMQLEDESATMARLEYISHSKMDQVSDLKLELGDLVQQKRKNEKLQKVLRTLKSESIELREVLEKSKRNESGDYGLDKITNLIKQRKTELKHELKDLRDRLKKIR